MKNLLMCSLGFLGVYVALYSVQNIQSDVLSKDGYGTLGFYSNAVSYLGQATGSLLSVFFQHKFGDVKSMSVASFLSIPFIVIMLIPAMKSDDMQSTLLIYSEKFVFPVIIFSSFLNGMG